MSSIPTLLRELRRLLAIQKEQGRNVQLDVVLKIGVVSSEFKQLGEKNLDGLLTGFVLATMPLPAKPEDPPDELMDKFIDGMHGLIGKELERLEKIHYS